MVRKTISFIVIMLLILTVLPMVALAGDENNPEIVDDVNDCVGSLIDHPIRFKLLHDFGILKIESYDFIDIVSAWLYENSNEPEYLYTAVKIKDQEVINQRAVYSVHWAFNGKSYGVGSHIWYNGQNIGCSVGLDTWISWNWNINPAEVTYDFVKSIVTLRFKKEYIGDPKPGDILTKTGAWTALRLNFEPLTILFSDGELVKDWAPNNSKFGKDYIIQY
jgi:hypothetical protein